MTPGLAIGLTAELDLTVSSNEVIHLGAGQPQSAVVFSTPSMIALMEYTVQSAATVSGIERRVGRGQCPRRAPGGHAAERRGSCASTRDCH